MKLTESLKSARKPYIYDTYFFIVYDDLIEYDKITRVKMLESIAQTYQQHPELILLVLNEKELRFLKKIPKDGYIVAEQEKALARQISSTFLLISGEEDGDQYYIPDELWDSVQRAVKNIPWDKIKLKDEENFFKLGVMKIYGALPIPVFMSLCAYYGVNDSCETPYIRRFHHYRQCHGDEYIVCDEYYEIEEELLYNIYENPPKLNIKQKEYILRIGKESFDLSNKDIKKFYTYVMKGNAFLGSERTLLEFICACHLNDFLYFVVSVEKKYFYLPADERYTQLFELAKQAFVHMPSGSLCGATPQENKNQQDVNSKSCLSKKEVELFYKVYFGILEYVNKKYRLFPGYKTYQQQSIDPNIIYSLRNKLFENKKLFDEFIKKNPFSFHKKELDLLRGFKRGIHGKFFVVRHDEEHSILCDNKHVYAIKGLSSTLHDALLGRALPVQIETVILPFGKVITYDSIIIVNDESIGINMKATIQNQMKDKVIMTKL